MNAIKFQCNRRSTVYLDASERFTRSYEQFAFKNRVKERIRQNVSKIRLVNIQTYKQTNQNVQLINKLT